MAYELPRNARRLPAVESSAGEIFRRLDRYHGIDENLASSRLHEIKQKAGKGGDEMVIFDLTGNVYDPLTLEWIGSLTAGGGNK